MKCIFKVFEPEALQLVKELYLNLMDDKSIVMKNITKLTNYLQRLLDTEEMIRVTQKPIPVSRATEKSIAERLEEIKGFPEKFRTTQLAAHYSGIELRQALEGLVLHLKNAGVDFIQPGKIRIGGLCTLEYDIQGIVVKTEPALGLVDFPAIEIVASICAQDFGLIIERAGKLIYLYSSSRYEKTPKHIETGYDYFLGEDFLEWHRRIPHWGITLAGLLDKIYHAFMQKKLDCLTLDLCGRNHYTNGVVILQRYERDYAVPLRTLGNETIGLIVFADIFFKDIHTTLSPFSGGKYLAIQSPRFFHQHFYPVKHNFRHHPFGIRNEQGISPKTAKSKY